MSDGEYMGLNDPRAPRRVAKPPRELPGHVRDAEWRAYWLDHDWMEGHPESSEYVRRRIPYEFGPDDDVLLDEDFEMTNVASWVLVRRSHGGHELGWIRVPLEEAFPQHFTYAGSDIWEFALGRPPAE